MKICVQTICTQAQVRCIFVQKLKTRLPKLGLQKFFEQIESGGEKKLIHIGAHR